MLLFGLLSAEERMLVSRASFYGFQQRAGFVVAGEDFDSDFLTTLSDSAVHFTVFAVHVLINSVRETVAV